MSVWEACVCFGHSDYILIINLDLSDGSSYTLPNVVDGKEAPRQLGDVGPAIKLGPVSPALWPGIS